MKPEQRDRREWNAVAENPPDQQEAAGQISQLCERLAEWWNSTAE